MQSIGRLSDDIRSPARSPPRRPRPATRPRPQSGMVHSSPQAAAASPERPSRSAPRQRVRGASAGGQAPPWATMPARGSGVAATSQRVESNGEDGAHARPDRLRRRRIRRIRVEGDRRRAERVRSPDDRPDVPGVPHAVEEDAERCRHLGPGDLPDGHRPRARPQRRGRIQERPLHLVAAQPGPGLGQEQLGLPARASAGGSRSSPSVTNSPSRSRCLRSARRRTSFSFSLSLLDNFSSVQKQKGRLRGARSVVCRRCEGCLRPPRPPGLARQIGGTPPRRGRRCPRASCG